MAKIEFNIITIFPKIFDSYFSESLFKRAIKNNLIKIKIVNLRDYTKDKHKKVDDSPFGGGPGMVLKFEPIYDAVNHLKSKKGTRTVLFGTRGKKLDQATAKRLSKYKKIILICGRYEGVDQRVQEFIADEEISIGDYVLAGGELPAMILIEAVSRQIKGFLGKYESLEDVKGSYPVYTRPAEVVLKKGKKSVKAKVPDVLLRGNHKEISAWREKK